MSKTRKKSGFRRGLFIWVIILVVLIGCGVAYEWKALSEYQAKQDAAAAEAAAAEESKALALAEARAPQNAFTDFVNSASADYWTDIWYEQNPNSMDRESDVKAFMESKFESDAVKYWKSPEYSETTPAYVIKNDDTTIATVTVTGSGLDWNVANVELLVKGTKDASIQAPKDCKVFCNDTELDSSFSTKDDSYFELTDYSSSLKNPVEWVTYTVTGQLFEPEINVEASADKTMVTTEDGFLSYVLSAQSAQTYRDQAEALVKKVLYYYMQGGNNTNGNMWAVLNLLAKESQAYKLIYDSYNGVTWDTPYPNATYEVKASDVTIWADNCYSVDVSYHSEGTVSGYTNVADGTYRVYFLDLGQGFAIYGLTYV